MVRTGKQAPQRGVFQITNLISGRIFIGRSNDLDAAMGKHRSDLRAGSHRNGELQKDWRDYGEKSFRFVVLDTIDPRDEPGYDSGKDLEALERMWLNKLQPYGKKGYNRRET